METYIDSNGRVFKAKVIRSEEVENVNRNVYKPSAMTMLKKSNLSTNVKLVVRNLYAVIALTTRHKIICKRHDKRLTNISLLNLESHLGHIKRRYWESMNLTKEWIFSKDFTLLSEEEQLKQLGIRRAEFVTDSYERLLADYWEARLVMAKEADHEQTVHEFEEHLNVTNTRVAKMEREIEILANNQLNMIGMFGKIFKKSKKV
jgi:hypothetical protein